MGSISFCDRCGAIDGELYAINLPRKMLFFVWCDDCVEEVITPEAKKFKGAMKDLKPAKVKIDDSPA